MNRHTPQSLTRILLLFLVVAALTAAWSAVALASEAPDEGLSSPDAAPNPPPISIEVASSNSIALLWESVDQTFMTTAFQVWRSADAPYFDPAIGEGAMIDQYTFPGSMYGVGTAFSYVDDGSCGYFMLAGSPEPLQPCTPQTPTVTVLGDVAHNYFWVLRAGNSDNEFDFANRVGEFDYALVKGG